MNVRNVNIIGELGNSMPLTTINMKAIFWDMDGVLLDSMNSHILSWKKSFAEFGFKSTEKELKHLGGVPFKETISIIAKKNNIAISNKLIDNIYNRKKEILEELDTEIKPFNITNELQKLKNKGIKMFVVTGAIREFTMNKIDKYFPDIFDGVITGSDFKKGKPNPEPYLIALKISGKNKNDCIVIEDAPLGILSGKNAGLTVFALETTLGKKDLQEADEIFKKHEELFDYLNKII